MNEIRLDYGYGRPWFDLWVGRITQDRVYSMVLDALEDSSEPESWPGERLQLAVAWAYFGGFEDGNTLFSEEFLTREAILDLFRKVLTPQEFFIVETVAVPQRFRDMAGADLERLAQRGDFHERVQSMVWLTLTGWGAGHSTRDSMADDEARLEEICTDPDKLRDASDRLAIADGLYAAGGPPPLAISGATLGQPRPGWRTITYMVPDELVEGSDSNGAALDPLAPT